MVYLIITTKENYNFVRSRISANGWDAVSYDNNFFVDIQQEVNCKTVYDFIASGEKQPSSTVVIKLSDSEEYYYWGRADNSLWEWLKNHSRKPITTWGK